MELYNVPDNSRIEVVYNTEPLKKEELNFKHLDGMYSFCTRDNGEVVHLAGWTEVKIIKQNKDG